MSAVNHTPIDHLVNQSPSPLHPHNPVPTPAQPAPTKESEPFAPPKEAIQFHEPIKQEHVEESLHPYIEVKKETPEIPPELQKVGLTTVDSTQFKDLNNVKLPISDEKVAKGLHAPLTSGLRWLAMFAMYLLQQSHMTLKTVHGHVVRVIKK